MDQDYYIAANRYGFYCIPESYSEAIVAKRLTNGHVYEPLSLELIAGFGRRGDIVSGGAFIGDFFPALSASLAGGNRLWSFEPTPDSHAAATKTIALNRLDNVNLFNVAVGENAGTLTLQVFNPNTNRPMAAQARIPKNTDVEKEHLVEVEVVPLDDLIPADRSVAMLHLDIEGHEVPALKGAARILREQRPALALEGNKDWNFRVYSELLDDLVGKGVYRPAGTLEANAFFLPDGE